MEQDENHSHDNAFQRKIDVEASSPGDVCGEGAADRRAEHRRNAKYGTKETLVLGPLL